MNPLTDTFLSCLVRGERRELVFPDNLLLQAATTFLRYPIMEDSDVPGLVVDVGMCVGAFTVAIRQCLPNCRVIGFEPYPPAWDYLEHNVGKMKDVEIRHLALSDRAGQVSLSYPNALVRLGNSSIYGDGINAYDAPTARMDDEIHEPVCFLKIDVEGAELDVLRGAEQTLTTYHPVTMIEMKNRHQRRAGRTTADILETMERFGYNDHVAYTPGDIIFMLKE